MTAVWFRVGQELRGRWRSTVALVVLMGLSGAVGVAALAGARRTDTAFDRFLRVSHASDAGVGFDSEDADTAARIARLPQVVDAGSPVYQFVGFPDLPRQGFGIVTFAAADDHLWRTVDRPRVLEGRLPRPDRPDEVAVSGGMARQHHLEPGRSFRVQLATFDDAMAVFAGGEFKTTGPVLRMRVAGVTRLPEELATPAERQASDVIYLDTDQHVLFTPAFYDRYSKGSELGGISAVSVRLRHGAADLPAFTKAAHRAAKPVEIEVSPLSVRAQRVERATHLQAVALYAFGALALAGCAAVAGQALVRQLALDGEDHPVLRSLGMTDRTLITVSLIRAGVVIALATIVAVIASVVASGWFPVGLARQAEPHPGIAINVAALAAGAALLALVLLVRAGLGAVTLTRRTAGATSAVQRSSRVADALARAGSPPSSVAGVRLALQPGRGRASIPVRSTLTGSAVAVAAIAMAVTFGASLDHLLDTPRLQGWNWDVTAGNPHVLGDPEQNAEIAERLADVPGVAEVSAASFARIEVGGRETSVVGIDTTHGAVFPPILDGREPRQRGDIVVGRDLMHRIHRKIGDDVTVKDTAGTHRARIVGTGLFPTAVGSTGDVEGVAPGDGAIVSMAALRAADPEVPVHQVLVRYDAHADPAQMYTRLRRMIGPTILRPLRASDVQNVAAVAWMPYALGAILLVFGGAAIGHLLVTSVRRRRADLAVLKTVGFVRGQVSSTVAWQATTLVAIALVVGLPIGIALGRAAWRVAADGLGVVAHPVAPSLLLLAVPIAVLVANLIAAVPGWLAGRISPAVVLRTE